MPVSELEKYADSKIKTPRIMNKLLVEMSSNYGNPMVIMKLHCKGNLAAIQALSITSLTKRLPK
tara:strand:+ start:1488 stop:1679 length:192 start_codon:yes stop_codon:yes gene_type:complete